MPDTSGPSLPTPLAFYDLDSSSWKTSQGTFLSDSTPSSLTLPASGMTLGGRLYELPMSGPATAGRDCSSLLNTPTVEDGGRQGSQEWADRWAAGETIPECQQRLRTQVRTLLPTPSAADGMGGHKRRGGDRGDELLLAGLVKDATLLPTPRTSDANGTGEHGTGGPDLRTTVDRLLPTPLGRDHKGHNQRHDETCLTGALDKERERTEAEAVARVLTESKQRCHDGPDLTSVMMVLSTGALTAPQSPATPPPSADPHPTLWTDEDG